MQIAAYINNGKDTLGFLPTGFGKTLCFVVEAITSDNPGITLVISPLLALMDDQMQAMKRWNISCIKMGPDTSANEKKDIAEGRYQVVFASPESVLKPYWRTVFLSQKWQERVSCLVIDEAHCLSEWGENFRPEYTQVVQLRSILKAPVLAVTATCTPKVKDDIVAILQLEPTKTETVALSPDRKNIYIESQKKSNQDVETELDWLIRHIKINGDKSKKVIIYCRSIDTVAELFLSLKCALGPSAYADCKEDSEHLLIEMYHKCTHDASKERILNSFVKQNSVIRCVIATVALGMGVDIPDVDMVIHYGCPKSAVSYWQEAGRCARDGRQGISVILYDNFTASLRNTDKDISSIVRNTSSMCIRQQIMDSFTVKTMIQNTVCSGCQEKWCKCPSCRCCSKCVLNCPCSTQERFKQFMD